MANVKKRSADRHPAVDPRALAETQAPRVRAIALQLKQQLGELVELGDLVGYGSEGLVEAALRYRTDRSHPFERYLYYRVRGAMLDAARRAVTAAALVSLAQASEEDLWDDAPGADEEMSLHQLARLATEEVTALPERERRLLELHYFEGLTLADAGAVLGLSRSWACRMHRRVILRLRKIMTEEY